MRVHGSGRRVQGSSSRVQGSGSRVQGSGFRRGREGVRMQRGPARGARVRCSAALHRPCRLQRLRLPEGEEQRGVQVPERRAPLRERRGGIARGGGASSARSVQSALDFAPFLGRQRQIRLPARVNRASSRGEVELPRRGGGGGAVLGRMAACLDAMREEVRRGGSPAASPPIS